MKKIRKTIALTLVAFILISMPVFAAETDNIQSGTIEKTASPRALITLKNVVKWSEQHIFEVQADVVVNDGTSKVIDLKNITVLSWYGSFNDVRVGRYELWNGGEFASVTITYYENKTLKSDVVKFYPN